MTSEFEIISLKLSHAERDIKDLNRVGGELCRKLSIAIGELNSGVDVNSDLIKGEINLAMDEYVKAVIDINSG